MEKVISDDGTSIAYERVGTGPALIAVDAAANYGGFRALPAPVELLAADFTVYVYDRRGRGASTDTPPYAIEREVDDIAALIEAAGGSAFLYGLSSGGLLALHAAASGLAVPRMALFEPPVEPVEPAAGESAFTAEVAALVGAGRLRDAVEAFHRGIGVPDEIIEGMASQTWAALEAVAHTLVYDSRLSDSMSLSLIRSVAVPTLVIDSFGSSEELAGMSRVVVEALPHGTHRSLSGEWHGVPHETLAPVLASYLLARPL